MSQTQNYVKSPKYEYEFILRILDYSDAKRWRRRTP